MREARSILREMLTRCTPLRWAVSIILLLSILGWSIALHMIYNAAHVPEQAAVESPRTPWSSKRAGQLARWFDWQQQLAGEAAKYEPSSPYDARSRLLLLGDSITEGWRGSSYGEPRTDRADVPSVLQETLGRRWPSPMVFGISGDQTQHVLWRLTHGEISSTMAADERLLVVLLIGTNNLAAGHSPEEVAAGIEAVASRVLNMTRGRLLINTLLPRGDGVRSLAKICPPRCAKTGKPMRSFSPYIDRVNYLLKKAVQGRLQTAHAERVRVVDCNRNLLGGGKPSSGSGGGGGGGSGSGGPAGGSHLFGGQAGKALGRAVDGAYSHVNEVAGGVRDAVIAGATKGASHLLSAGEDILTHGVPTDEVSYELFLPILPLATRST